MHGTRWFRFAAVAIPVQVLVSYLTGGVTNPNSRGLAFDGSLAVVLVLLLVGALANLRTGHWGRFVVDLVAMALIAGLLLVIGIVVAPHEAFL